MANLHDASTEWAFRPADQRFWTLEEMNERCLQWRQQAREASVACEDLMVEPDSAELVLRGRAGMAARVGHYAFGQLSRLVGAPADYLRSLPAGLAAPAINHGLRERGAERPNLRLLLSSNGDLRVRAVTSEKYARIWNSEVVGRLMPLRDAGWRVPPARPTSAEDKRARYATTDDCLKNRMPGIGINPGDLVAPAGLYASEKDMFAFMVNEDRPVDDGQGGQLFRGFFVANSEVGDRAWSLTTFLYNAICGNHIVWGASEVTRLRVVHIGDRARFRVQEMLQRGLRRYVEQSAAQDEGRIRAARFLRFGANEEEVVGAFFPKKIATRGELARAYRAAGLHEEDGHDDPGSAWGMAHGLTRIAQETNHADKRTQLDRAAGKVLQMAF